MPESGVVLNLVDLRAAIQEEYEAVAVDPGQGFHFHTGRPLAALLGYRDDWLADIPEASIESFAGTGNPFSMGELHPGEQVVDVGYGAGIDSLIAARMVGSSGQVNGVDMTPAMLTKARRSAAEGQVANVSFRDGFAEALPVPDAWADVVISNGCSTSCPIKPWRSGRCACPEAWRSPADRRYPGAETRSRQCQAADRPVDGLNCRCSAGSRVSGNSGSGRLRRVCDHLAGGYLRGRAPAVQRRGIRHFGHQFPGMESGLRGYTEKTLSGAFRPVTPGVVAALAPSHSGRKVRGMRVLVNIPSDMVFSPFSDESDECEG